MSAFPRGSNEAKFLRAAGGGRAYEMESGWSDGLMTLFDHGFVVDRAPVWSRGELEGSEFAIISRTYLPAEQIDNAPKGLRVWRIPPDFLVAAKLSGPGVWVATVVQTASIHSEAFLQRCGFVPVNMLPFVLSKEMHDTGHAVELSVESALRQEVRYRILREFYDAEQNKVRLVPAS